MNAMTKERAAAPHITPEPSDPYKLHSLEKLLSVFDAGTFHDSFMRDHRDLLQDLQDHREEYGHKGCKGEFTLRVSYVVRESGDVHMVAERKFKGPQKPASQSSAFINQSGMLTLYNPLLAQMQRPVRDASETYDAETGEIIDAG
ncbi:hypothetical protein [Ponticoccus alexandrii]|uniref:Uncharacterized protein n=1 Tax=Ponticoccus alexandrii TaxID=1943633 RepID=A0ABX7F976_9RHOB|nr:hypothetical protein [Ponticoccus alexandrii]ETA54002.1 hypothetical protein P279_00195 [Rhodobacteraceae bacterium PD-2]QRF66352.1 hypothetical protein GQA70_08545 [Ponticoccus alexandrii]